MGLALYGTDFHGKTSALRHCFRLAGRMGVRAIILGGDLTPKTYALKFKSGTLIPSQLIDPDEAPRKVGIRLMEAAKLQRQKLQLEDGSFIFEVDPEISIQRLSEELFLVYKLQNLNKGENTFTPDEIQKIEHFLLPKLKEIELSPAWKEGLKRLLSEIRKAVPGTQNLPDKDLLLHRNLIPGLKFFSNLIDLSILSKEEKIKYPIAGAICNLYNPNIFIILQTKLTYPQLCEKASAMTEEEQKKFIKDFLFPEIQDFKASHPRVKIYAQLGNDDTASSEFLMEEAEREGLLFYLHGRVRPFPEGLQIAGLSFVPPTPFKYKRWERSESGLEIELNFLASLSNPKQTIYVLHAPPKNTRLDLSVEGHLGSSAVGEFISKYQPYLVLTGHIHEAPQRSGYFHQLIDNTLCLNPGGEHPAGQPDIILFEPRGLYHSLRLWYSLSLDPLISDLKSLVTRYPQVKNKKLRYVFFGGTALRLLLSAEKVNGKIVRPALIKGRTAQDIDICCFDEEVFQVQEQKTIGLDELKIKPLINLKKQDVLLDLYTQIGFYKDAEFSPEKEDVVEVEINGLKFYAVSPEFLILHKICYFGPRVEAYWTDILALREKFKLNKNTINRLLRETSFGKYIQTEEILKLTSIDAAKKFSGRIRQKILKDYSTFTFVDLTKLKLGDLISLIECPPEMLKINAEIQQFIEAFVSKFIPENKVRRKEVSKLALSYVLNAFDLKLFSDQLPGLTEVLGLVLRHKKEEEILQKSKAISWSLNLLKPLLQKIKTLTPSNERSSLEDLLKRFVVNTIYLISQTLYQSDHINEYLLEAQLNKICPVKSSDDLLWYILGVINNFERKNPFRDSEEVWNIFFKSNLRTESPPL